MGNIIHRQDGPTNSPITGSAAATTTSNQPEQTESSGGNNKESTTANRSRSTFATLTPTANSTSTSKSATVTADATTAVISNINGASPTSPLNPSTYNSTLTPDKLPLTPEVTPAFGVGGVILLLSGVVYTLIGMKNTFLHVYLSAAYLSSLAVTVLILYVMNPPVSNAIQGAYLVAIVMTGLILGGAAIVFTEMTEGLGSLLGGFCFSMWLLVLQPGGLLKSTSSKAVFIAAFTVAAFSTSFSHYTRPYGVIGGISFGGATAVVLGIDCFSRAGLKEFWAYLWDLNDNLFPLGATTYPLTRGMKVEIAAIIIIFLAGIVSQMKLWKVIKERREQRASERLQDERTMEQEEENVGRRVENAAAEDRSQWEAVYGNKERDKAAGGSIRDSGVGDMESQKKGPRSEVTSVRRSDEEIEMSDIPTPAPSGLVMTSSGQEGGQVTVRVARDPETPQLLDENGNTIDSDPNGRNYSSAPGATQVSLNSDKIWVVGSDGAARLERRPSKRDSKRISGSVAPEVVPLPFKVPEGDVEDDRSSVATFADDEEGFHKRRSKHLSVGSMLMRKLSGKSAKSAKSHRDSKNFTSGEGMSTDDLVIPRGIEDDRASSIAATMDGLSDDDMRSVRSSFDHGPDTTESARPDDSPVPSPTEEQKSPAKDQELAISEEKSATRPVSAATVATDILEPATKQEEVSQEQIATKRKSLTFSTNPKSETQSTSEKVRDDVEKQTVAPSVISAVESKPASITKDRLPPQLSKVVMSYRTNEWAKHLSSADAPELDELKLAESPVEKEPKVEVAAPVNVEELQQTAENTAPRPASRAASQMSSYGPTALTRSTSSLSKAPPQVGAPRDNHFPPQTQDNNLNRSTSQLSLNSLNVPRGFRSSSGPLIPQQIVESPIEEDFSSQYPGMQPNGKFQNSIPFGPSTTLLGKRDSMLRSKTSYSANHATLATTPEFPQTAQSASRVNSEAGSLYNYPNTNAIIDDDEMSLSARRDLIRGSSFVQAEQSFSQPVLYDSHQPKRQSSAPHPMVREQQLASWRASVQQDLKSTAIPKHTIERSRSALWQERQAEEQKRMMEERKRGERDSKFDERMRRGDMLDAHREALRRMQATANRNA